MWSRIYFYFQLTTIETGYKLEELDFKNGRLRGSSSSGLSSSLKTRSKISKIFWVKDQESSEASVVTSVKDVPRRSSLWITPSSSWSVILSRAASYSRVKRSTLLIQTWHCLKHCPCIVLKPTSLSNILIQYAPNTIWVFILLYIMKYYYYL